MMRSLYSGVAGLRTHQTKMDVLGNNIANVNTTSYKSQSITFSDLMYQTTQTASGASETKGGVNARQIGLGAKSGAISTAIESQGATQTTNNPFDIMITGSSFFIVNNGKENLYTRDGSFYVDGAGNLAMQSNGYFVQGWAAKEDKKTGEIQVDKNGDITSLQIMSADNATYSPASTTQGLFSGNIDDHDTNVTSDDGKTITLEFYDNKGYLYTGKFTLKDTGYDHMFSLELKDIIDSNGQSINTDVVAPDGTKSKKLDHVTVGSKKSSEPKGFADGYSVEVVDGVAKCYQNAGKEAFTNVPVTGDLINLATTASGAGKNVLYEVYGKDDSVITGTGGYGSEATYEITTAGLKITYDVNDVKKADGANNSNYQPNFVNNEAYFINSTDHTAYKVPGASGDAEILSENLLKDVFGISATDAEKYITGSDGNTYSFEYLNKKINIYKDLSLTSGNYDSLTADQKNLFPDMESAITTWLAADPSHDTANLKYTFDDSARAMKIIETVEVSTPASTSASTSDIGDHSTADFTTLEEQLGHTDVTYTALVNIISDDSASDALKLAAQYYINKIDAAINAETTETVDPATITFSGESLTGTKGITIDFSVESTSEQEWTSSYSQSADNGGRNKAVTGGYDVPENAPTYVYYNKTANVTGNYYDKSYYLDETETTLDKVSEDMLRVLFEGNTEVIDFLDNGVVKPKKEYNLTFSSNGAIEISHEDNDILPVATDESSNPLYTTSIADGKVKYTTATNILKYTLDSLTGDISDISEMANGKNAGLLNMIYGLNDEYADAFGSNGTFSIDETTGKITLTTDDKTVQLLFNSANGSLVSANGDMTTGAENNGLVDIVFDQSIDGLEAFGYQKQNNDGDDVVLGRLTLDFSTVTNYNTSGSSTVKAVKGDKKSLNTGRAVGEMNGVNISTDGRIYATYSNGQTKLLGQIASAQFANASGLSKEGDNLYSSTLNSGEATVQDITTDGGYMNTGVLEMSNVDLSREFTEMITTQRGFQANSRIITVSDTLLEELTNLKR